MDVFVRVKKRTALNERKEEIKRLNYRLKKLDRFYRNIVLALGIMSPVFLVLYLAAEHCFWFCWFVGFILGLLDAVSDPLRRRNLPLGYVLAVSARPERVTPSQNELDRREFSAVFGALVSLLMFLAGLPVKFS